MAVMAAAVVSAVVEAAVFAVVEAAVFAAAVAVAYAAAAFTAEVSGAAVPRSMVAGSEAVALRSIAAFVPRPCSAAAACATDIAMSITGRTSATGITSTGGSTRRPITATHITMATGSATAA